MGLSWDEFSEKPDFLAHGLDKEDEGLSTSKTQRVIFGNQTWLIGKFPQKWRFIMVWSLENPHVLVSSKFGDTGWSLDRRSDRGLSAAANGKMLARICSRGESLVGIPSAHTLNYSKV